MTIAYAQARPVGQELTFDEIEAVSGGWPRWVSAAGGAAVGVAEAGHAAGAIRAGMFGARVGAFAGPLGLGIGVVAGVGTYYMLEYINSE